MKPPGFNQPNVQNNQNRYQGTNSNFNQNRGGNFNQNHQNHQVFQSPTNQPPVYQVPPYQAPTPQIQGVSKTDFENYVKANDAVLKNVQNQGQNLQNQMANVTSLLTSLCDNFKNPASTSNTGTLPSQTVTNPRQQINAITTRSGKTLEEPSTPLVPTPKQTPETSTEKAQNPNLENTAHVIGLKDALIEMPKFNKWLSSLLRNKEKLEEIAITTVNAECSVIIMNKVPEKLEDPRKFLILCALQELNRTSALADSGASINLLPHSIYKKLELEALTPTRMTLKLPNRSITHPMGIADDVVVRVDGFTFLADFVVVNFEPDLRVPIYFQRFLGPRGKGGGRKIGKPKDNRASSSTVVKTKGVHADGLGVFPTRNDNPAENLISELQIILNSLDSATGKLSDLRDNCGIPNDGGFHDIPITALTKEGLSAIATKFDTLMMLDSYTSTMCTDSWVRVDTSKMFKLQGFSHVLNEFPKNIVSDVLKNLKNPRQAVSDSNPFDALNTIENDDELDTNVGNSMLVEKGANFDVVSYAQWTSSEALDDDRHPIENVDDPINADGDSEVDEMLNKTTGFMASMSSKVNKNGSGVRNKSLYEQWKETDNEHPYDDDDFDNFGLTNAQMKFANSFDIDLRGQHK
ncbi:reverse transcriptase domain-containing protein [Tanacetum coccineum]